ncbi:MAG TPA: chemotaxis protein CheW [Thermoanaerobaculia bacterium]|nr:chemotaxis protein CheW [Thermoanaerobaculia bacterium]
MMNNQYLTFAVSGDEYGVAILRVKEIIAFESVTRVPRTPAFIRGVINLRGSVVPVIDVARKFGYGETVPSRSTCTVIVEAEIDGKPLILGLLVDAVSEVVELLPDDIQEPPRFGTQIDVEFLVGMGRAGNRFVLLLDIDKVLAASEVAATIAASEDAELVEAVV